MLTFVTWLWGDKYTPEHVNRLCRAIDRNLSLPHRHVCLADSTDGIDAGIEVRPLPHVSTKKHVQRLWIFSKAARALGERLVQVDVDVVVTGALDPLFDRAEPLVIWKSDSGGAIGYALNPTLLMVAAGARADLWDHYRRDPARALQRARAGGCKGSDQAIITDYLRAEPTPVWTEADGVLSYRRHFQGRADKSLPEGTRFVSFHGYRDPAVAPFNDLPWVKEHWR
jgi:hypothetical protein